MNSANLEKADRVRAQLEGGVIAATPIPFRTDGKVHEAASDSYMRYVAAQPLAGVAVWAHTGRGLKIDNEIAENILSGWRMNLPSKLVIAGVGARENFKKEKATERTVEMTETAARLGADALLVHPPTWLREHAFGDELIVEYHQRISAVGLPIILFYLYEAAGGISYGPAVLDQLLDITGVIGIKMATLDSVMTYQDVARQVLGNHPDKLLITGEDRFLGYSLQRGAKAALIGMASVCCDLQTELVRAHFEGDAQRFLALSQAVDALAEVLFVKPMGGYIRRILWALAHLSVIPFEAANDPWGPQLAASEFEKIGRTVAALPLMNEFAASS
jgi:4-hydroxy-tetrahydrodipicolinate synthase